MHCFVSEAASPLGRALVTSLRGHFGDAATVAGSSSLGSAASPPAQGASPLVPANTPAALALALKANVIIVDLLGNLAEALAVCDALKAWAEGRDAAAAAGLRRPGSSRKPKTLVAISSVNLTWDRTPCLTVPEDSATGGALSGALQEAQYTARVPAPGGRSVYAAEEAVLALSAHTSHLLTHVVAAGAQYGCGESLLRGLFSSAAAAASGAGGRVLLPALRSAEAANRVPTVHIADLAAFVARVAFFSPRIHPAHTKGGFPEAAGGGGGGASVAPASSPSGAAPSGKYFVAVDAGGSPSVRSIAKTVLEAFGAPETAVALCKDPAAFAAAGAGAAPASTAAGDWGALAGAGASAAGEADPLLAQSSAGVLSSHLVFDTSSCAMHNAGLRVPLLGLVGHAGAGSAAGSVPGDDGDDGASVASGTTGSFAAGGGGRGVLSFSSTRRRLGGDRDRSDRLSPEPPLGGRSGASVVSGSVATHPTSFSSSAFALSYGGAAAATLQHHGPNPLALLPPGEAPGRATGVWQCREGPLVAASRLRAEYLSAHGLAPARVLVTGAAASDAAAALAARLGLPLVTLETATAAVRSGDLAALAGGRPARVAALTALRAAVEAALAASAAALTEFRAACDAAEAAAAAAAAAPVDPKAAKGAAAARPSSGKKSAGAAAPAPAPAPPPAAPLMPKEARETLVPRLPRQLAARVLRAVLAAPAPLPGSGSCVPGGGWVLVTAAGSSGVTFPATPAQAAALFCTGSSEGGGASGRWGHAFADDAAYVAAIAPDASVTFALPPKVATDVATLDIARAEDAADAAALAAGGGSEAPAAADPALAPHVAVLAPGTVEGSEAPGAAAVHSWLVALTPQPALCDAAVSGDGAVVEAVAKALGIAVSADMATAAAAEEGLSSPSLPATPAASQQQAALRSSALGPSASSAWLASLHAQQAGLLATRTGAQLEALTAALLPGLSAAAIRAIHDAAAAHEGEGAGAARDDDVTAGLLRSLATSLAAVNV